MRRKKRSHFPIFLFLCLLCLLLLGIRQRITAEDPSFSLPGILKQFSSAKDKEIASSKGPLTSEISADIPAESSSTESTDISSTEGALTPVDNCYSYYYEQLSDVQQSLYHQLYACVSARKDSVSLNTTDSDTVHKVYHFLLYDHPELFWCVGSSQSQIYTDRIEFMPEYSLSLEEIASRKSEIESQADVCLSGISADAGDYEKVCYVYTWLINTVDYDENASDNQNIYSSLVGHASVCAGYAKGMQYLLNRLSIPCIYLTGTLTKGGSHAWNMVCCNGTWYQSDVTFGDPVFANTEDLPKDNLSYAYLCCTDAQIQGSHIPDQEVSYPACTSMDLNYYVQNGWFVWSYDEKLLKDQIITTLKEGEHGFTLQCANSEVYRQVCAGLLDTIVPDVSQTYMELHGLKQVNYKYSKDTDMLIFSLYWITHDLN